MHAARPPARHGAGLENPHPGAALGEDDRGRHARVSGPHDGDPSRYALIQVRQAIQNFLSGVSEVRRESTRKPSSSISSSSLR